MWIKVPVSRPQRLSYHTAYIQKKIAKSHHFDFKVDILLTNLLYLRILQLERLLPLSQSTFTPKLTITYFFIAQNIALQW